MVRLGATLPDAPTGKKVTVLLLPFATTIEPPVMRSRPGLLSSVVAPPMVRIGAALPSAPGA